MSSLKDIKSIDYVSISKEKVYFLDANIWLLVLSPPVSPKPNELKYINFFNSLKKSNTKNIVITSILLSEIINRYLKNIAFSQYCRDTGVNQGDYKSYKDIYRKDSKYKTDLEMICSDINVYNQYCIFSSDSFGEEITLKELTGNPDIKLDFNDSYYYMLCKNKKYCIVTDDSDFFVDGVEIITGNMTLIKMHRNSIKPIQAKEASANDNNKIES